jgi:hypothetical protein
MSLEPEWIELVEEVKMIRQALERIAAASELLATTVQDNHDDVVGSFINIWDNSR